MPSFSKTVVACGALASALAIAATTSAQSRSADPEGPCFFVTEWKGWSSPDPNTLYLRVNMHDIYKVSLSAGSPSLAWPDMHLVSVDRGGSSICTALDLDLKVADTHGFAEPLIARSLRKLTPEEVAAIPKKYLPGY
ncbi:MAG: hypothetical protein JOZ27_06505 [Caulobacteraceae bacterium]|nr:hypothetical protein [Caulobacteraceae bacterium]